MRWWKRKYVGHVTGVTKLMDKDRHLGTEVVTWTLTEGPFGRRAKQRGSVLFGLSPAAQIKKAKVDAWLAGGPLPPLDEWSQGKPQAPVLKLIKGGRDER